MKFKFADILLSKLGDEVTYYPKNGKKFNTVGILSHEVNIYDADGYSTEKKDYVLVLPADCLPADKVSRGDRVKVACNVYLIDGVLSGDDEVLELALII